MTTLRRTPESRAGLTSWPFTPIDELDLYLESAADPSLIQLETLVRGHLDPAALEAALADVLAADPAARRHLAATSPWRRRLRRLAFQPTFKPNFPLDQIRCDNPAPVDLQLAKDGVSLQNGAVPQP